jgi:hypothetical protein
MSKNTWNPYGEKRPYCYGETERIQIGAIPISIKPPLSNYKSHLKHKRRTSGVVNHGHFIDVHCSEHFKLKFMLIDNNNEDLRKCENVWIDTLLTNLGGFNAMQS